MMPLLAVGAAIGVTVLICIWLTKFIELK